MRLSWLTTVGLVAAFSAIALWPGGLHHTLDAQWKQQALAKEWGVNVEDYAPFPIAYFYTKIRRGTPLPQVHAVLRGYDRVLRCGADREVYYYFGTDDRRAVRIEVLYDSQSRNMISLHGDDSTGEISTHGCQPGQLGQAP